MAKKLVIAATSAKDSAALKRQTRQFPKLLADLSNPAWNQGTDKQKIEALRNAVQAVLEVVSHLAAKN